MTHTLGYALTPVSFGELLDKISILEIKRERITDPGRHALVATELKLLQAVRGSSNLDEARIAPIYDELKTINLALWDIEDSIREHEHTKTFDAAFIALARSVYKTNDQRALLKGRINSITNSIIAEQKSYFSY